MATLGAGPATEYSTKFMFFKPVELAVTVTVETVVGNCSVVRARPFASVTTEVGLGTAPLLAVKLIVTPGTPFLYASWACAMTGLARLEPAAAVGFAPPDAMIRTAAPGVTVAGVGPVA